MTNEERPDEPAPGQRPAGGNAFHQEVQHSAATARVPEAVGRGVFATGAVVMNGPHDVVLDFIQGLAMPRRVVARVALPPTVIGPFASALQDNLRKYQQTFGPVPRMPFPPAGAPPAGAAPEAAPPISDLYEQIKLPDELLSGVYANTVIISHGPAEFCLDFVTNFYPRPAVSARVFIAAPHVPELHHSLVRALEQVQQRAAASRPPAPPPVE